jgi:hypothetical protein
MSYRREVEQIFGREPHMPPGVRESEIGGDEPSHSMSLEDLREIARAEEEWNDPNSDEHR